MDEATISATSGGAADAERFLMVADGVQYGPFAEGAHASSKPSSLPLLTGACCSPDFGHHVDRQRQDLLALLHLKEVQVQRTEEERKKKRGLSWPRETMRSGLTSGRAVYLYEN